MGLGLSSSIWIVRNLEAASSELSRLFEIFGHPKEDVIVAADMQQGTLYLLSQAPDPKLSRSCVNAQTQHRPESEPRPKGLGLLQL